MKTRNIIFPVLVLSAALSCNRAEISSDSPIMIGVGVSQLSTKAGSPALGSTEDNLSSDTSLNLYSTRNGSALHSGAALSRQASTGLWYPSSGTTTWASGSSYTFYCTAQRPASPSGSSLTMSSPTSITIEQPSAYEYGSESSQMIDYMLSYVFNVADGATYPLVQIELEHAFALVEFYVIKASNVTEAYLQSMTLNYFYNAAQMTCSTQQNYGSDKTNVWSAIPTGEQTCKYTFSQSFDPSTVTGGIPVPSEDDTVTKYDSPARMIMIAVPQMLTVDRQATLTVEYYINEGTEDEPNYVRHNDMFILDEDDRAVEWKSGHRYVYTINLNTRISLQSVVSDWVDVDYIEGTVLPDIEEDNE